MDTLIESELSGCIALLEQRIRQIEIAIENNALNHLDTELAVQGFR